MNSVVFLEWFENPLMPALKNPSLVVLDNASYHNVKTEVTVSHHPLIWPETLNRSRHFAYLHAKQSNVYLYPRVFLGHQTHHSEATYNLQ
jgi:hypothetical protein